MKNNLFKKIFLSFLLALTLIVPAGVSAKTPDWLFKTAIEEHYDFGAFIEIRIIKKIVMVTSLKGNE